MSQKKRNERRIATPYDNKQRSKQHEPVAGESHGQIDRLADTRKRFQHWIHSGRG